MRRQEKNLIKDNPVMHSHAKEEMYFVKNKLDGFNPYECEAWKLLTTHFGKKIRKEELLSLATVLSHHLNIQLFREDKRQKSMLIKWYNKNIMQIWPFIVNHVVITDKNDNQIVQSNEIENPRYH